MPASDTLLKIRIWLKVILLALLVLYAIVFVWLNSGEYIDLWLFPTVTIEQLNVFVALVGAFLLGALLTVLVRTILTTVRQIRQSRERGRTQKLEREIADMRVKSNQLQQRKTQR